MLVVACPASSYMLGTAPSSCCTFYKRFQIPCVIRSFLQKRLDTTILDACAMRFLYWSEKIFCEFLLALGVEKSIFKPIESYKMADEDWAAAADEQERRLTGQVCKKRSKIHLDLNLTSLHVFVNLWDISRYFWFYFLNVDCNSEITSIMYVRFWILCSVNFYRRKLLDKQSVFL